VSAGYSSLSPRIAVINGSMDTITRNIVLPDNPDAVAVSPDTGTFYVASNGGESVYAYNGATDTVTGSTDIGGVALGLAVNPDTDTLYAAAGIVSRQQAESGCRS